MFKVGDKVVHKHSYSKIFTVTKIININPLYIRVDGDKYIHNGSIFESLNKNRKRKIKRICSKLETK